MFSVSVIDALCLAGVAEGGGLSEESAKGVWRKQEREEKDNEGSGDEGV